MCFTIFPIRKRLDVVANKSCRIYQDQLEVTERHLDILIEGANDALQLLASLADSFRAVESQTSSFQAQCDDLLTEEKRLRKLADEVGTDLHYYAYLDGVTRRLNAPGASRLVDHQNFGEILTNLDACIGFMMKHVSFAIFSLIWFQIILTINSQRIEMPNLIWPGINPCLQKLFISLRLDSQTTLSISPRRSQNKSHRPNQTQLGMPSHTVGLSKWCSRPMVSLQMSSGLSKAVMISQEIRNQGKALTTTPKPPSTYSHHILK